MIRDVTGGRLFKAIVLSLGLHLALVVLIQPAPGKAKNELVLQARIVNAAPKSPVVARPVTVQTVAEPPPAAVAKPPAPPPLVPVEAAPLPPSAPPPAASAPQPAETVTPPPAAAPEDAKPGRPESAASQPSKGLAEVPVMLDTQWYTAQQVDRRPELTPPVVPAYPEEARRRGIEGNVVIEVHIDEFGRVRDIEVLEANPPGVFEAAVIEVYGQASYSPAMRDGRPVRYRGRYRVSFELD